MIKLERFLVENLSQIGGYGCPCTKTAKSIDIGELSESDLKQHKFSQQFFVDTPHLWQGKKILDLGCGNKKTREQILGIYPDAEYVGLDIENGEGVDIVYDARRKLPFQDGEFDTICAFGFLPVGFFNLGFPGNVAGHIRHWRRPLKIEGYFVAGWFDTPFNFKGKPEQYRTIRRTFRIIEERVYSWSNKKPGSSFAMPIQTIFDICVQRDSQNYKEAIRQWRAEN